MPELPEIAILPETNVANLTHEGKEYICFPIDSTKKGVRTIEIPKSKFKLMRENIDRWQFMEVPE